jgi:peptide/nickel transport system substrate-binding protein
LLEEAGWYDRDGDGLLDKDGKPLALEFLIQAKNISAENFARVFQEALAAIGVRLTVTAVDNATYFQRIRAREFDIGIQGWAVDATENDPAQLWHSSAAEAGGSNHAGVVDEFVDGLIARGQVELDDQKRQGLWRELHRYLAERVVPCIYREASPRRFALNRELRGVQFFKITPGYSLRRWYWPVGTSGTRATREN